MFFDPVMESMARVEKIRDSGTIPERRHDAFLVALLLAVCLNIAFFIVQALIPRLASLLQVLGAEPAITQPKEEETEAYPFVLVDPSFLEEEPERDVEAEANLSRRARQTEARPDLPELSPTIDEGVEEILTAPPGNPGPAVSYQQSPDQPEQEPSPAEDSPDQPTESRETDESQETREADEQAPMDLLEPLPEMPPPEPAEPLPDPPPEPQPEPSEPDPPPEPETPDPEPSPEPEPVPDAPEPSPEEPADPLSDAIDIASLPAMSDGLLDPETQRLEEMARRQYENPPPRQRREQVEPDERTERQPPRERAEPQRRDRGNRPRPQIKRIGPSAPSSPSSAGGAPRRKRESTAVRLLDADASMALLAHRYGPYMEKLARQLQDSLFRQMILSPTNYASGQVKIRFGIGPDGQLAYYVTVFPDDDMVTSERTLSEAMLREAAPFDPLTPEMQQDPNFQRMTVIVHLY